jgi:hypothetical protein
MKKIYIITTVLFLSSINLIAQTNIVTGLNTPFGIALHGDDLYIAESNGNKISKIDITAATPTTATDVVTTALDSPSGLVLFEDDLYIAEYNGGNISKIDITATPPTPTVVVTGLDYPSGLALHGDDLYIAEFGGNKISKINITAATPTTATAIITGVNSPWHLIIDNNILYISRSNDGAVSKVDLSSLSLEENLLRHELSVFPNPSSDFIHVSGLTAKGKYSIFNILGAEIKKGTVSNQEGIDIRNFKNGLYFLKLDNGNIFKFMKE